MIQGFRKLVDFAESDVEKLAEIERRLKNRKIRYTFQRYTCAGENRDETVWRVYVYAGHFDFAQDELARMEIQPARKVVAIS